MHKGIQFTIRLYILKGEFGAKKKLIIGTIKHNLKHVEIVIR